MLQFFQAGNDLIVADALDTNFENFVDVIGFFDPANTDTLGMCSISTETASRSANAPGSKKAAQQETMRNLALLFVQRL
jgi:hypothetical protein